MVTDMSTAMLARPTPGQLTDTFQHRVLKLTFALGKGNFGDSGFNTLTVSGLRTSATISKIVGASQPSLELVVFGLTLDVMNQLTTVGKQLFGMRNNTIMVEAGDANGQMSVVYQGLVYQVFADMSAQPETALVLLSTTNGFVALKPVPPTSYKGAVDVAVVMSSLAALMGYSFENSGVSVMLRDPYFWGTAWQQVMSAAQAANINVTLDLGVLAIWPLNGSREGDVPIVSAGTGLVGYPRYTDQAVSCTTLFNPAIGFGGSIQLESILTPANGIWTVKSVTHRLETEMPGGVWFTDLECSILGSVQLAKGA
jgi:hypothetical protein